MLGGVKVVTHSGSAYSSTDRAQLDRRVGSPILVQLPFMIPQELSKGAFVLQGLVPEIRDVV